MFLIAGVIRQLRGSMDLGRLGGIYGEYPKISLLIALVLFSLVGIPPLSGFWPKIYLFQEAFGQHNFVFAGALVVGSLATLYVIAYMWTEVFWKDVPDMSVIENKFEPMPLFKKILLVLPVGILACATLYIGLYAEGVVQVADRISNELINTTSYIEAVLGPKR